MKPILFIAILLFNINFSFAQSLKIELNQKIGYGPFQPGATTVLFHPAHNHPLFNTFYKLEFNNISKDLIEVKKGIIPFDFLQFLYQNLCNTENFKLYEDFKKQRSYTIADEELSTENIDCFVKIIYAKNSEHTAICIIDANQNGNFNDDIRLNIVNIQSLEELKTINHKIIETAYQYSNGKNIINNKLPVIVFTHNNALKYSIPTYMVGQLTNEEKIYVSHEFRFPDYWVSNININADNTFIKKRDTFVWNNKFFKNNGVDIRSNTLDLTEELTGDHKFTLVNLAQPDIKPIK